MSKPNSFLIQANRELESLTKKELLAEKHKIAVMGLTGIAEKMPVDTGRAKSNTIVSVGSPDTSWVESYDKVGNTTISTGLAVIAADQDPYSIMFVQNNVPYIEALEGGWSKKAPLGMLGLTVAEIDARFK